jgi:hypothetical protein
MDSLDLYVAGVACYQNHGVPVFQEYFFGTLSYFCLGWFAGFLLILPQHV